MNKQVCENLIKFLGNLIRERCKTEGKYLCVETRKVNSNIRFVCSGETWSGRTETLNGRKRTVRPLVGERQLRGEVKRESEKEIW
jgi:hypothetical protein